MTDDPYTRVPNALLDAAMADTRLNGAAFRVLMAIVRKIVGWHKGSDAISYGQLQALTGIQSPATIRAAIVQLTSAGYITVTTGGKWDAAVYQLSTTIIVVDTTTEIVAEMPTTEIVVTTKNVVDTTTEIVVTPTTKIVDTKEIYKERKERGTATRKRATVRPRDLVFETVAAVCGIDWTVCTEPQRQQLNQTVTTLRRAAEKHAVDEPGTLDRIRHTERYWQRIDWRGKQGQPPTPAQLREVWGAAMKTYAPPTIAAPSPAPSPETLDPAGVAEYLRSKRNGSHTD